MSVYKRGEVWHYDFAIKGQRYRGSTGFTTKGKAERFVENLRTELKLGTPAKRKVHTLREAADKWYAAQIVGKKSDLDVALRLKIVFRHMDGNMPVTDIGPREIADAILKRRVEPIRQSTKENPRYPKNATVNRDLIDMSLRPILNYAESALEEPVRRINWSKLRLKEPKGRARNFTDQELAAWREELPEWHRPVFDFIARYGVRLEEAFFPPAAVNVEARSIVLTDTKNGSEHQLQILDDDMPDLAARKSRAQTAAFSTIWIRDHGGGVLTPIHPRGFQRASMVALGRAGVTDAKPVHDLRHHAATTLFRSTGNIKLVQDLLNHASVASSARYAHTNKDDLRRALRHTYDTTAENEPKKAANSK